MKGVPFKPGFDPRRNVSGRPRLESIASILHRIGMEEVDTGGGKLRKIDLIMRKVVSAAIAGKPWAVEFIADRTEGKATQTIRQILSEFTDDTDEAHEAVQQDVPAVPGTEGDHTEPGAV